MRLHRFFVSNPILESETIEVEDFELLHQLRKVFRFTVGGQVILFDNSGMEYKALIQEFGKKSVTFSIISKREGAVAVREVHLFISLLKKDNFEWILQKGTELGVTKFVPIISSRSEKKNINLERARKIIKEASEQSGRSILPDILDTKSFEEALNVNFPCFAFDPGGDIFTIEHAQKYSPLGIFVGPEGGWSNQEIMFFKRNEIRVYSLGPQVLRAETAAIAISSLLLLQ